MNAVVLRAEGLAAAATAAAPLDLRVAPGEVVCLLGPQRQAMIATLRTLAGIDPPGCGRVELLGRDPALLDRPAWYALRRAVGYVTAEAPLLSVLSGRANLMLPGLYHRIGSRDEIAARVDRLVAQLDEPVDTDLLPAFMNRLDRRFLAVLRALVLAPAVLFVEEPFRGLEVPEQERMGAYLAALVQRHGVALVVATKSLHFIRFQADRMLFLGRSRVSEFDRWQCFVESREPEILEFRRLERIPCDAFG